MVRTTVFFVVALSLSFISFVPSRADLIAYWDFEDGEGSTTLTDRTGNGFDGDLIGNFGGGALSDNGWTSGGPGSTPTGGLAFDLSPDTTVSISLGLASNMDIDGDKPKSVSFWAKWNTFGNNTGPFQIGANSGAAGPFGESPWGGEFSIKKRGTADQSLRAQHWGSNTFDYDIRQDVLDDLFFDLENWGFYVVQYDGDVGQTYLNGQLAGERTDYPDGPLTTNDNREFTIGTWQSFGFDGIIDDMAVWNQALTQEEINRLVSGESPLSVAGLVVEPGGDFNGDGVLDILDIDALYGEIGAGTNTGQFDVNGDGTVNTDDVGPWLANAGSSKGFSEPIRLGDANLDGVVDAGDLNDVGVNWQSNTATSWSQGDFNVDGKVDALDLNGLGLNWQSDIRVAAAPLAATVPEPGSLPLLVFCGFAYCLLRLRTDCCRSASRK